MKGQKTRIDLNLIFFYNINLFLVIFDQFNALLPNRGINFFKKKKNGNVCVNK